MVPCPFWSLGFVDARPPKCWIVSPLPKTGLTLQLPESVEVPGVTLPWFSWPVLVKLSPDFTVALSDGVVFSRGSG